MHIAQVSLYISHATSPFVRATQQISLSILVIVKKRVEHIHSTLPKQPIYLREKRSLAGRAKMSAILACIVGGAAARPQFGPSYELPPAYCHAYPATRAYPSQTNSKQHQQEQLATAEPSRVGSALLQRQLAMVSTSIIGQGWPCRLRRSLLH